MLKFVHLFFPNGLKDLDNATLVGIEVDAFENLAEISPSDFANNLVNILITARKAREQTFRKNAQKKKKKKSSKENAK